MSVYRQPPDVDTDENDIDDVCANEAWQTRRVMLATVQTLCMQVADGSLNLDERCRHANVALDLFNCAEDKDTGDSDGQ